MLDADFYRRQCARLREENEELIEEVGRLKELNAHAVFDVEGKAVRIKIAFGMTYRVAVACVHLMNAAPHFVSRMTLIQALESKSENPLNLIKVQICKMRAALDAAGCPSEIHPVYGHGYTMSAATAEAIRQLIGMSKHVPSESQETEEARP